MFKVGTDFAIDVYIVNLIISNYEEVIIKPEMNIQVNSWSGGSNLSFARDETLPLGQKLILLGN